MKGHLRKQTQEKEVAGIKKMAWVIAIVFQQTLIF